MAIIYNIQDLTTKIRNDVSSNLADELISTLQTKSSDNLLLNNKIDEDILSELKSLGYNINDKSNDTQIAIQNFLSKIIDDYKIKNERKIQLSIRMQIIKLGLSDTENPEFKIDRNGHFYRLEDNEYIEQKNIIEVNEKLYIKKEAAQKSNDMWIIAYDTKNKPVSYKLVNTNDTPYKSREFVAKKLSLKKEYVKPFKMHGYNGNANGFFAEIGNMFASPTATGCYIDKNYNIFKWNNLNYTFTKIVRTGIEPGAPMVSDYEFKGDTVIRTDYDGYGLTG